MTAVRKFSPVFGLMTVMNCRGYTYDIWYEGTSLTYAHRVCTTSAITGI